MDFERRQQIYQLIQASIVTGQTKEESFNNVRDAFGQDSVTEQDMDVFYSQYPCSCFICSAHGSVKCARSQLPFDEPSLKAQMLNRKLCKWKQNSRYIPNDSEIKESCLIDDRYMVKCGNELNRIRIIDMWLGKATYLTYKHPTDNKLSDFDPFNAIIQNVQMINNELIFIKLTKNSQVQQKEHLYDYVFGDDHYNLQRPTREGSLNRHERRRLAQNLNKKWRPKKPVENGISTMFAVAKLNLEDSDFEIISVNEMEKLEKRFNIIQLDKMSLSSIEDNFFMLLHKQGDVENESRRHALQICHFDKDYKLNFGKLVDPAPHTCFLHLFENKFYSFDTIKSMTTYTTEVNLKKMYTYELDKNQRDEWKTTELEMSEFNGKEISKDQRHMQTNCWHKNHLYITLKFDENDFTSVFVFDADTMGWKRLEFEVIDWVSKISVDCNENLILLTCCRVGRFFRSIEINNNYVYRVPTRKPEPLFQLTFFKFNELAKDNPNLMEMSNDLPIVKCILKEEAEIGQEKKKSIPVLSDDVFSEFLQTFKGAIF